MSSTEPTSSELLVVLSDPTEGAMLVSAYTTLHSISPRMLVIRKPAQLGVRLDGALLVTDGEVPTEVLAALTPVEQQWALAWNARKRPKQRAGDGEPWDNTEFYPPDFSDDPTDK